VTSLLHLLGSTGLRRAEASAVLVGDVDERRRSSDPRLRQAIKGSTSWWVTVRSGKRGRSRAIPLDEDTLAAITAWVKVRPTAATDHLLLSLRALGSRRGRSARATSPATRRPPGCPRTGAPLTCLRHTFCTHLADSGADTAVIRELAGHADIRTTTIYTAVSDARLEHAIEARSLQGVGARRAAGGR
jgi:site-specific recombinase XerD